MKQNRFDQALSLRHLLLLVTIGFSSALLPFSGVFRTEYLLSRLSNINITIGMDAGFLFVCFTSCVGYTSLKLTLYVIAILQS